MFSETSLMMPVQIPADIEKTPTDIVLGHPSTFCRNQQGRQTILNATGDHAYSKTTYAIFTSLCRLHLLVSEPEFQRRQAGGRRRVIRKVRNGEKKRDFGGIFSTLPVETWRSSESLGHPKSLAVPSSTQECVQHRETTLDRRGRKGQKAL